MAESGEGDMAGSWWGGWLQAAKEKSTAALDMVRKDLAEFGCTMQQDTGHVVGVTSTTLKESLKAENASAAREKLTKGLNTFLEGISKALVVPPDDDDQIPIIAPASECYDRTKARLHAVQVDPGTYIKEPSGSPETYSMWCEGFDLDSKKGEVSDLLVSKVEVRALYTKLVPSRVSHVDFWRRYFYKLHQIDVDQARKEALMRRAEISRADDSFSWDDEWSGDEAAEDSGSDWEKLPRPNQQRPSPDSPTPIPTTPPSSSLATTSPTPKRRKDSEKAAKSGADRPAAQPQAASAAAAEFHDISLEEKKHSGSSEASRSSSEEEMVSPVETSSSFSSSDPPASASSSSPIQETSSSAPHQPNAEAFKEYLKLSAGTGEASPPPSLDLPSTQCLPPEMGAGTHVEPEASRPADSEPRLTDSSTQSNSPSASLPEIASPAPETAQQSPTPGSQIQQESELPPVTPAPSSAPEAEGCAAEASSVQQALSVAVSEESTILKTTERGDLVVVGSDHGSPMSNASESKVVSDVDDEWEQDLDIELTEEDMKAAEELAKKLGDNLDVEDDWESWE